MLNITERERKTKYRHGLIACLIITLILFSGITPLIDWKVKERPEPVWFDPNLADFLYVDTIEQTTYNFNAYNESYIISKIQNTDYTTFTFNNSVYNVSYGINYFPIDFGMVSQSYSIIISQDDVNNNVFDWISVQPLYIKEDVITVNMTTPEEILFNGSGLVSILFQPNFTYNNLYLEVDDIVINDVYSPPEYPKIDSIYVITWKYGGTYLQFDLHMEPGQHQIEVKGNGTINYKIISSYDWDNDLISDVEEVQKQNFNSELDPTIPNVWGYFEKGNTLTFVDNYINETSLFRCFIPEEYTGNKYLSINVLSGRISDIIVDNDVLTLEDVEINADYMSYAVSRPYGLLDSGFHFIEYKYDPDMPTIISFSLGGKPINILDRSGMKDTDADGLKDVKEINSGTEPNNPDTDYDGLLDSADASPLANLTLGNDEICQLIIPHDSEKNTLVDIVVQKPENDYSTGDETMVWKGLEVSIHPVLRMFGNSSITMSELTTTWDKDNKTYSLTNTYPTYGDGILNSNDENGEMTIIPAVISEETIEFSLSYFIDHVAKDDDVIDIRFDIVWLVLTHYANSSEIIHYYDFDEDILIQSLTMREIQNVSYIMASPDSMIENEILWNLVQNDELGEPIDFGVDDDVVIKESVDYKDLTSRLIEVRDANEISKDENGNIDETEVTYFSMNYTNYDILNQINILINFPNPSFEVNHSGDFEVFFSFYIISEVKEEDTFTFRLGDDLGENKICYIKSWNNYTDDEGVNYEERFNIIEFPILMNNLTFNDAEILEITYAYGPEIPLNKIPYSVDDNFHDKIILRNETFIEKTQSSSGIPELSFNYDYDIYKESFDNRLWDVEASKLMFNSYSTPTSQMYLDILTQIDDMMTALAEWADINLFIQAWETDMVYPYYVGEISVDPRVTLFGEDWDGNWAKLPKGSVLGMYRDAFSKKYYSKLSINERLISLGKFKAWIDTVKITWEYQVKISYDRWQATITDELKDGDPVLKGEYERNLKGVVRVNEMRDEYYVTTHKSIELLREFKRACLREGLKNYVIGGACIVISLVLMFDGFSEITSVLYTYYTTDSYDEDTMGFLSRLGRGILKIALGFSLCVMGIYYIINGRNWRHIPKIASENLDDAFKGIATRQQSIRYIGKICMWISIALIGFEFLVSLSDLIRFGGSTTDWIITIAKAVSFLIPIAITFLCSKVGGVYGFIAGVIISIIWMIWDWTQQDHSTIHPSFAFSDDATETYLEFPIVDIKRHGSLEVGDEIKFHLNVTNDGDTDAWMRANFSAGGSDWSADQGEWSAPDKYIGGQTEEYTFSRTLPNPQAVTELKIGVEADLWDGDSRENVYEGIDIFYINMPILDSNIADFYDDTTEWDKPNIYNDLIGKYEMLKGSYQHKDIGETLNKLSNRVVYDFLNDTTGNLPSGWNEQKTDFGVFTTILRPESDDTTEWSATTNASYFWSEVDDDILNPFHKEEEDYIGYWAPEDEADEVIFDFPTISDANKITQITAHMYCREDNELSGDPNADISFNSGTSWKEEKPFEIIGTTSYDWNTVTWTGLNEASFNNFQLKLIAPDPLASNDHSVFEAIYVEVTYEKILATNQEIISSKDGYKNVMEIEVYGEYASYNFYRNIGSSKPSGTIEFWLNRNNYSIVDIDKYLHINQLGHIYEDDGKTLIRPLGIMPDEWYNLRIVYNDTYFDAYLNGIKIADNIVHSKTDFTKVEFITSTNFTYDDDNKFEMGITYIDCVDFFWSTGYYDGRSFAWDYTLDEIQEYGWAYGNLSIFTNIDTDLSENIVEMDTTTDIAEFDFYLDLEGTHNPTVNYTFSIPNGFSITPNGISQSLDANVVFNISANDPFEYAGIYYFEMNITFSDNNTLIYTEKVPFRIPVVEDFQIDQSNIIFEETDINGGHTATHDFLDDGVGGYPSGWSTHVPGGTSIEIISNLDEHDKVIQIYDNNGSESVYTYDYFSAKTEGSITFWFRTSDISKTSHIQLTGSGGSALQLWVKNNKLQYYDGSYHDIGKSITANTWYRFVIEFEIGEAGEGTDDWHLWIDNQEMSSIEGYDFYLNPSGFDRLYVISDESDYGYYIYFDAIGYSWDTDYFIRDNMYRTETNSDTYQSSTQLEKGDVFYIEYKTNTYAEVIMDFLNNDVIQATYTVVPRGNLFKGIQSKLIILDEEFSFDEIEFSNFEYNYFEVYHISIIDAGITGSQQFNPLNFTNNGNVPEFVSFSFSGVPFDNISQTLYPNEFFGETQIAVILPNSNRINEFNITLPGESISNLFWRGITYSKSGTNEIYNIYADNLEIDGIHILSPENKTHNIIGKTISSGKYELSLDILPEENLVWSGYSLNGQPNVTFSTSANITLPETEGIHTIQVFGNNSVGTMFESEVRNFTIQYPIKILTITNGTTYYDTNNTMDVNITSIGSSVYTYSLDGRSRKNFNGTADIIDHIPFGSRKIVVYGDDLYGEEYRSGLIEFHIALDRQTASQPDGFTLTNGTFLEPYGDLQFIDGNYTIINADVIEPNESLLGTIKPSGSDIITNWNEGDVAPHYSKLDEYPPDNDGDGGNIRETYVGTDDRWNFNSTTIPEDHYISKLVLKAYAKKQSGCTAWIYVLTSLSGVSGSFSSLGTSYSWKTITISDLNFDQSDLDNFWMNVIPNNIPVQYGGVPGWVDIECVYVDVYITPYTNELNIQVDMQINDTDLHEVEYLQYSHKTNASAIVDLDIWDWTSSQWDEIESINNYATFDDHRVILGNNSDYLNLTDNSVRIRYQSIGNVDIRLEIDSLKLLYSTNIIPLNLYETPIQPDNFNITKGTFDTYGELGNIDGNYTIIESTYTAGEPEYGDPEYINSITYDDGGYNSGNIANTQTDNTQYYCGSNGGSGAIDMNLIFNPALNGRDFKISAHIHGQYQATMTVYLKINGATWKSGKNIDFDDEIYNGVNTIELTMNSWPVIQRLYLFYFKLVPIEAGEGTMDIDFQIDLQIDDEYCYFPNSISYSYKTNVSMTVDFDIWNWDTESWYEIESVNNYETFDDDIFYLDYNSVYVNSTNGIRIRFQALECENDFQIEIDQLRLDYYNIG